MANCIMCIVQTISMQWISQWVRYGTVTLFFNEHTRRILQTIPLHAERPAVSCENQILNSFITRREN